MTYKDVSRILIKSWIIQGCYYPEMGYIWNFTWITVSWDSFFIKQRKVSTVRLFELMVDRHGPVGRNWFD